MADQSELKALWEKIHSIRDQLALLDKQVGIAMHDIEGVKRDLTGVGAQLNNTKIELSGKLDFLINKHHESEGAKKFAGFIKALIMFLLGAIGSGITIYKFMS